MIVRRLDPRKRRDVTAFIRVPFGLHRESLVWVPPVVGDLRRELNPRRNPFFEHSDAAMFLAVDGGRALGRVLVMEHRPYNRHVDDSAALFDMFECADDPAAAAALFDAAADWARSRGLSSLTGPRRFLGGSPTGVLVEGFDHPPSLGLPHHPPYYRNLMESSGFSAEADFVSGYMDPDFPMPSGLAELSDSIAAEHGFRLERHTSRRELWRHRMEIVDLHNRTFEGSTDFCPLQERELAAMARRMVAFADPDLLLFIRDEKATAAYLIILPDVSDAIRRSRGRLLPLGWLRILVAARRTNLASMQAFGVLPEYRGTGANVVAYGAVARVAAEVRYERAELVMIDADNHRMLANVAALGGIDFVKRRRLYRKRLVSPTAG